MSNQTFDIIFSGQLIDGQDPDAARRMVGQIFKADDNQLDTLFSGNQIVIKSDVDDETATKYRVAFRKAGALIEIKPSRSNKESTEKPANEGASSPNESGNLTLLPPNTGSLIDCAKNVDPQPIPDIDHISLASLGATLDESPDPIPAEIDTSDLSLNPPNSGTLEDCKKEVEPYPIPDISHLDVDDQ